MKKKENKLTGQKRHAKELRRRSRIQTLTVAKTRLPQIDNTKQLDSVVDNTEPVIYNTLSDIFIDENGRKHYFFFRLVK
jgi:hypothetical protein